MDSTEKDFYNEYIPEILQRDGDFSYSSWEYIGRFLLGQIELVKKYNLLSMKDCRDFIQSGIKCDSYKDEDGLWKEIERLEKIREECISSEMSNAKGRAKVNNKKIKEEYLNGKSLDPVINESFCDEINGYPSLRIYNFLSWYDPVEIASFDCSNQKIEENAKDDEFEI